jgi:hypothetical protein
MMDHPELPMPDEVPRPAGPPAADVVPALACIVAGSSFGADGLRLTSTDGVNPRFAGVITRESFAAPMRIDLVVRPLIELRLVFGRHNQYLAFNERGEFVDVAPWFLRLDEEKGTRQGGAVPPIGDEEWARVTIEVDERERRVLINGRLRHTWAGDFSGLRSRLAKTGQRDRPRAVCRFGSASFDVNIEQGGRKGDRYQETVDRTDSERSGRNIPRF